MRRVLLPPPRSGRCRVAAIGPRSRAISRACRHHAASPSRATICPALIASAAGNGFRARCRLGVATGFHLHGLDHHHGLTCVDMLTRLDLIFQHGACHRRLDRTHAVGDRFVQPRPPPSPASTTYNRASALSTLRSASKAGCCAGLKGGDLFRVPSKTASRRAEAALLDLDGIAAVREVAPLQQLVARDRKEADLVEEAQQPGLASAKASVVRKVFHTWMVRPKNW